MGRVERFAPGLLVTPGGCWGEDGPRVLEGGSCARAVKDGALAPGSRTTLPLLAKTLLDPVQDGSQLDERAEILVVLNPN